MNKYYYDKLNAQEQRAYQEIYTSLMLCLPAAKFSKLEYYNCDFGKVFRFLNFDHPELYFVNFVHFHASQNNVEINVQFSYLFPKDEVNRVSAIISQKSKSILSKLSSQTMSIFEKEIYIYDYLTQNIIYDAASISCDVNSLDSLYAHSITGVFLNGKAVCDGISKAFLFLCRKAGIPSIIITGEAHLQTSTGPHAWNLINIDGSFYHVDVTGDLKDSSNSPIPLYRYLNISDVQMRRDHSWDSNNTPQCNSEIYNYYSAKGLLCKSAKDVEKVIRSSLSSGETHFSIKYNGNRNEVNSILAYVVSSYKGRYRQYGVAELPGDGIYLISV